MNRRQLSHFVYGWYDIGGTGGGGGWGDVIPFSNRPDLTDYSASNKGGSTAGNKEPTPSPVVVVDDGGAPYTAARQLEKLLIKNPLALIDIPCDQLAKWQEVSSFIPPKSVTDKLKNLDNNYTSIISGDWDIQYIENASSPIVNMDYFPVSISQLPKDPATGTTFTPANFFNHVRKNLNSFFEGNSTTFGPYNATEAALWNSNNYLGAIMRFDIAPVQIGGLTFVQQDGSVICSYQNGNIWRFTTIESPQDWSHPVSGTREFGLTANADGTYTFYTRGVDRVAESTDDFMGSLPLMTTAYDGGDALWTQFQNNLTAFVNKPENGGAAQKVAPRISRPDWEKVKAVLRGERPISDFGCK